MKNTLLHQTTKRNSEHAPAYTNPNRRPCHQNSSMKKNCEYVKKKIDIAEEEERTETKNNLQSNGVIKISSFILLSEQLSELRTYQTPSVASDAEVIFDSEFRQSLDLFDRSSWDISDKGQSFIGEGIGVVFA
ncbi:hypothetical protein R6Q59_004875 [Mikania micrantha]